MSESSGGGRILSVVGWFLGREFFGCDFVNGA